MSLKFGTDGIRGVANEELSPELALSLGLAAVPVFECQGESFLIGRDTRLSGPMLQAALSAGIASAGAHPIDIGVVPTPAVAFLSARMGLPAAMISASHNPFGDNGIKFFLPGGKKLSDEIEERLEAHLASPIKSSRLAGAEVGSLRNEVNATAAYEAHLISSVGDIRLDGLSIVLDCANGAAHAVAPNVFTSLGANVTVLFDEPNGANINDGCGSTHPQTLQETVAHLKADVGFAFDGDADRVLASDSSGALIDGDHLLALLAVDAKASGRLKDDTLVVTVMANLGLKIAMEEQGVHVHETPVGDRYVLEALDENNWSLGGEQSGHVIIPEFATTGDGILAALQTLAVMVRSGSSLNELSSIVTKLPQVLRNVRVDRRELLDEATAIWEEVAKAEDELGKTGRVLLRTSGTEPVVRVMVEAATQHQADEICSRLCDVVARVLAA